VLTKKDLLVTNFWGAAYAWNLRYLMEGRMNNGIKSPKSLNIGFVSTRFTGTDGVSLEIAKWAEVLEEMGHTCYYFSGLCDRPGECSMVVPEAFFRHPDVQERHDRFWHHGERAADDTRWIHVMREYLRSHLEQFIREFSIDVLIPENALAIPLNIPLGLALTELIAEMGIPTIAHHHDFTWERKRFLINSVRDYINMAFPPNLPSIHHVVTNSMAHIQLAHRKGIGSLVTPNVMNFEKPAPEMDNYSSDLRKALGLKTDELLILQPTRVVNRKGIEHAVELVSRLDLKARLVIIHASGDEGYKYEQRVRQFAEMLGVPVLFASSYFDHQRGITPDGRKVYSLWDVYPHADLVTYPSMIEGFGNAFLETIYFRKPIVVNNYLVYAMDIRPKGFRVNEFDNFITDDTVEHTRKVLAEPALASEMCEWNYQLGLKNFSYSTLRANLQMLLSIGLGI
jgi:glycosyltransferase involved in cell wall biosynthesis